MRIMVDLNVLLDVAQNRTPFRDKGLGHKQIATEARAKSCRSRRKEACFQGFPSLLTSAPTKPPWRIIYGRVPKTILTRARSLPMTDFEDCVVAASAEAAGCDHVVTRNVADFAGSPVPALTPADFLKLLPTPATEDPGE